MPTTSKPQQPVLPSRLEASWVFLLAILGEMLPSICRTATRAKTILFFVALAWMGSAYTYLSFTVAVDSQGSTRSLKALSSQRRISLMALVLFGMISIVSTLILIFAWISGGIILKNRLDCTIKYANDAMIASDKYDIYLPAKSSKKGTPPMVGLIFFPGSLIDHRAYVQVATQLARCHNVCVIVINHEPYRMTGRALGHNTGLIPQIQKELKDEYPELTFSEWAIGGHSWGTKIAVDIAEELPRNSGIQKLVLWGKLSHHLKGASLSERYQILIVNGTNDAFWYEDEMARNLFVSQMAPYATEHGKPGCIYYEIEGGNHSGFANYGPQTFPKKDGARTIPLEEQHRQVVELSGSFLQGKYDYSQAFVQRDWKEKTEESPSTPSSDETKKKK